MNNIEWKYGYPDDTGFYNCLYKGKETILYHFQCRQDRHHSWKDFNWEDVKETVRWKDKAKNLCEPELD